MCQDQERGSRSAECSGEQGASEDSGRFDLLGWMKDLPSYTEEEMASADIMLHFPERIEVMFAGWEIEDLVPQDEESLRALIRAAFFLHALRETAAKMASEAARHHGRVLFGKPEVFTSLREIESWKASEEDSREERTYWDSVRIMARDTENWLFVPAITRVLPNCSWFAYSEETFVSVKGTKYAYGEGLLRTWRGKREDLPKLG